MLARSLSIIADEELDSEIRTIKTFHPNRGSKNLAGYIASRNVRITRQLLRQSLQRGKLVGIAERRCRAINWRVYLVSCLLALWHLDGSQKLIRWRFVVHSCIDGVSRILVYLSCNTNKKAPTV